jgi:hypothetical protein
MTTAILVPVLLSLASFAPAPSQASVPAAPSAQLAATVPAYANRTCPIMGKEVSARLWTDTELGRIWVCCKSCIRDIHEDFETAYRTAYPETVEIQNERCPVTGAELDERSPRLELQGFRFGVRDQEAAAKARASSQIVLAKLRDPKLVDVGNDLCPIDGKPVAPNAFVVIDGRIVRLSSPKNVEAAQKDPARTLAKALEIARTPVERK